MGILDLIGFGNSQNNTDTTNLSLGNIYPFSVAKKDFVSIDIETIYKRIIVDVLQRTEGISDEIQKTFWDSPLKSETSDGLVSLISQAMVNQNELFLVAKKLGPLGLVVRVADDKEKTQIKDDYAKQGHSKVGVYISFKNYHLTNMLRVYSVLEYLTISSLDKSMNLSKAIQLKITDLRRSIANDDAKPAVLSAQSIAKGLNDGQDVILDSLDEIETALPDINPVKVSMDFIAQKKSYYLGLPVGYISGVGSQGLGDSGSGEAKAVERGLLNYYFSIVKPVLESLFNIKTTFETEDFESITTSLELLKTFELTSTELISSENKLKIINRAFGLPEDAVGDEPEEIEPPPPEIEG